MQPQTVTIDNLTGRMFDGTHGDGGLAANGNANADTLPVSNAIGAGFRGGVWFIDKMNIRVSDRNSATGVITSRDSRWGFRAVRSAP